ncbi:uncharacterized protein EV422DRAFT_325768 [Fimicolochytrium jonesii]|uniref:uncharacterized protein n=1 Tax=Fimicolochytrium jonesii TaxID=1396493 RepID=UPI0022FE03EE|nr:uncharacterized protein EV422DRAFT_325768 [Fimicolochytrium jonesii]KAI8824567.1 hypothetical protein EV422DRAFT_325768 [Fimicolochytrium jonesii]
MSTTRRRSLRPASALKASLCPGPATQEVLCGNCALKFIATRPRLPVGNRPASRFGDLRHIWLERGPALSGNALSQAKALRLPCRPVSALQQRPSHQCISSDNLLKLARNAQPQWCPLPSHPCFDRSSSMPTAHNQENASGIDYGPDIPESHTSYHSSMPKDAEEPPILPSIPSMSSWAYEPYDTLSANYSCNLLPDTPNASAKAHEDGPFDTHHHQFYEIHHHHYYSYAGCRADGGTEEDVKDHSTCGQDSQAGTVPPGTEDHASMFKQSSYYTAQGQDYSPPSQYPRYDVSGGTIANGSPDGLGGVNRPISYSQLPTYSALYTSPQAGYFDQVAVFRRSESSPQLADVSYRDHRPYAQASISPTSSHTWSANEYDGELSQETTLDSPWVSSYISPQWLHPKVPVPLQHLHRFNSNGSAYESTEPANYPMPEEPQITIDKKHMPDSEIQHRLQIRADTLNLMAATAKRVSAAAWRPDLEPKATM